MDFNKRKSVAFLVAALLVISILGAIALYGIPNPFTTEPGAMLVPSVEKGVVLGLDLVGGSVITYEAQVPAGMSSTELDKNMGILQSIMRRRVTTSGFTEATVSIVNGNRIRIEIPAVTNPEEAVKALGSTAKLEFRDADGKVVLSGSDIASAARAYGRAQQGDLSDSHYIKLELKPEAVSKFAEATRNAAARQAEGKNYIAIYLDEDELSRPSVHGEINSAECIITMGNSTREYVEQQANLIQSGQLPFEIKQVELRSIGPTLGAASLQTSLLAGFIGLILVIIFMIGFYRIPGVMASIALLCYVAMIAIILSVLKVNLSLPGIAGIILSIGMAVDANVIIFERLKEELRAGKTLRVAVKAGFSRAFWAIFDSNLTTVIAAVVLWRMGTGPIVGFAVTLLIGVLLSMFTVLVVSRFLLNILVDLNFTNLKAYALGKDTFAKMALKFNFIKKFKLFGIISIALVATAVVSLVLLPFGVNIFNLDIDFVGGTTLQYEMHRQLTNADLDEVGNIVKDAIGTYPSSVQKSEETQVIIKTSDLSTEQREDVHKALSEKFSLTDADKLMVDNVSPVVGADLSRSAVTAALLAAVLILLYITVRFEFRSGSAAVITLVHDILVMISFYVIFRIPLNMNFLAVALTILGYSINAAIVVFDRIRENVKLNPNKKFGEIVNTSTWQSFTRSMNTTITTLLPVIMLIILGVPSIRNFALPLTVGLIAGAYSSICLAGPLWFHFKGNKAANES